MYGGVPRVVYLAVTHWRTVFFVGLVMVAVGVGVAAVADVPTTERPDGSTAGSITFERTHSARAVDDATTYEPGTRLQDRSLYLQAEAPNLTVREVVRADGPPVDVTVESRLVYRVAYAGSTIYRESGPSARRAGTLDDDTLATVLAVNTSRVRQRRQSHGGTFGPETEVEATIATRVTYGDSGAFSVETPIEFTSRGYSVATPSERARYGSTGTVRVPDPGRTVSVGGTVVGYLQALGVGIALLGLGTMAVSLGALRRVTAARRRRLRRRMLERRFDQLVAVVEEGDPPAVDREMASLEDLTYVGEDAGAPVIRFEDEDRYVVRTDDVVYGYAVDDASAGSTTTEATTEEMTDDSTDERASSDGEAAAEGSTDADEPDDDG